MTNVIITPAFAHTRNSIELILYPTPDAVYSITMECRVNPSLVAAEAENDPLHCGESHLLTVLEACYCAADNLRKIPNSPYERSYQAKLMASIVRDRDFHCPDSLGLSYGGRRQRDQRMLNFHLLNDGLSTYLGGS